MFDSQERPKNPEIFEKRPPCTLYLAMASSRLGYPTYVPAKSKNYGVAGTDQNLGTGLTNLNYLLILSLSTSIAFLSPTALVIMRFFPSCSKKSKLSSVMRIYLVVFSFCFPLPVNKMSYKLSNFTCLGYYVLVSICMVDNSYYTFWNSSC